MLRPLLIGGLLCFCHSMFSQQVGGVADQMKYIDIVGPSPGTATLSKINRPSTGLSSGSMQFNAPLTNVEVGEFSFPISLSYSSNGVLVDEIASRVGMSWQLIAGGSVTRVVQDVYDESETFQPLSIDVKPYSKEFLHFLRESTAGQNTFISGKDSQQDLFSYNFCGYSGKFILDPDHNVIQQNQTNLRIDKPVFNNRDAVFAITDAQGNTFYFGGDGYTENSSRASCSKGSPSALPTAWFISKIVLNTGHVIEFKYTPVNYYYDLGINETMYYNFPNSIPASTSFAPCPVFVKQRCVNTAYTNSYYLTAISAPDRNVAFTYADRQDCGDKLLSAVEVVSRESNKVVERYAMNYDIIYTEKFANAYSIVARNENRYRPFLKTISRESGPNSLKLYQFSYNRPEDLPVRITYAQDHWGYFNGVNNSTLIPHPAQEEDYAKFPDAVANRETVPEQASKGMLSRITYSTGGFDSIEYEPNTILGKEEVKSC